MSTRFGRPPKANWVEVDAGRTTLDELLRRVPALTVADERLNRPFARAADRERFLTGLRKAGLPEG